MRHFARRDMGGNMEIIDSEFNFVRAILPYDYRYTCNAQQRVEADRICQALEGPMSAQGLVRVQSDPPQAL